MVAPFHDSGSASISQGPSLLIPIQEVERYKTFGDRVHGCNGDKATSVVEALVVKRMIEFLEVGQVDVTQRMLDITDLVMGVPGVGVGVEGFIYAEPVNRCGQALVQL